MADFLPKTRVVLNDTKINELSLKVVALPENEQEPYTTRILTMSHAEGKNCTARLTAITHGESNRTYTYDIETIREVLAEWEQWEREQ